MTLRLVSWNVNGIRAAAKKGMVDWARAESPDVLCLQEVKAQPEQVPEEILALPCHQTYSRPERKGYSGVGTLSKVEPLQSIEGFDPRFDSEGRLLRSDYDGFTLLNVYFPNGKASAERLAYKMDFYTSFQEYCRKLRDEGRSLVICGDVNTAHKEIDLARPKENSGISGFLPEERAWIDSFLEDGYLDSFRLFNEEGENYSWWSMRTRARERNVGWRIDYFLISDDLRDKIAGAGIMADVMGSDHCPVYLDLRL